MTGLGILLLLLVSLPTSFGTVHHPGWSLRELFVLRVLWGLITVSDLVPRPLTDMAKAAGGMSAATSIP